MAVKWIGDAAQELGIHALDAVEILASRQEYPMNGLIDEDRFKTLRLMRGGKRLETSGSQAMPLPERLPPQPSPAPPAEPATPPPTQHAAPPPPPAPPPATAPAPAPPRLPVGEATSVTAPFQAIPGKEGERTVILSPIDPKR
jgi:hypothetical protein